MLELNRLYNMDCMEGMKQFPDKYFNLAIVDPPYGIGEDGGKNHTRGVLAPAKNYKPYSSGDVSPPNKEYFKEIFRVSKNQIFWGANHYIDLMPYPSSCWHVWDKENGNNDFADCELAWTSFKSAVRIFRFRWAGMLQGDMKNKEFRIHPNQKPVKLYEWQLSNCASKGDKIINPYTGSASDMIACYNLGFDYIGFEIDTHYYDLAQQRLESVKSQVRIEL